MYPYLLFFAFFQAPVQARIPLIENCFEPEHVLAVLTAQANVRIRSAIAGDNGTCYAVTALLEGKGVTGYVIGDSLPGVVEYERQRRQGASLGEEPLKEPTTAAAIDGRAREVFEDFDATDLNGKRVSLKDMQGKATVVCFWSPAAKSQSELSQLSALYDEFHERGLNAVAVSVDPSPNRMLAALDDFSTSFPNVPDRLGLARSHKISTGSAPQTFVLNPNHEIVAVGLHGDELQKAVLQLIGQR